MTHLGRILGIEGAKTVKDKAGGRFLSNAWRSLHVNPVYNLDYNARYMIDGYARKEVGSAGEDVACKFLERKGYTITVRNYRKKWGEIDIIGEKDGVVRFVEVKTVSRESPDYRPEELVDARKLRKIARTASLYMETIKDKREYQIDVVGVILNNSTKTATCRLFEQALEGNL